MKNINKKRYEISEKAEEDLFNIEEYLLNKWNVTVLENFFFEFQRAINILLEKKVLFKKYEDTHFHQYLVTRHNSIIYYYESDVLYIVRILQNFQDPDELQIFRKVKSIHQLSNQLSFSI